MTDSAAASPVVSAADRIDTLRLSQTTGVGPINFARLMTQYGSAGAALAALPGRMRKAGRRDDPAIPSVSRMTDELERLEKLGGKMLVRGMRAIRCFCPMCRMRHRCCSRSGMSGSCRCGL